MIMAGTTARGHSRNWTELPDDFTAAVFSRLGAIETIETAQKVCMKWRRISQNPLNWLKIDMRNDGKLDEMGYDLDKMCRHAISRSRGNVVDINIEYFATDELLMFITNSASGIKRLRLLSCDQISDFGLGRMAWKLPLLEELDISLCVQVAHVSLEVVGNYCPLLKSLKLNKEWCTFSSKLDKKRRTFSSKLKKSKLRNESDDHMSDLDEDDVEDYEDEDEDMDGDEDEDEDDLIHDKAPDPPKQQDNADAFAIARTMHGLHLLQLYGNKLTNNGLKKILDFCPHLESLDLRCCYNLNMEEVLSRRCAEKIKNLLLPHDSTEGKEFTPRSEGCCLKWIELPDDIMASILSRFKAIYIVETIQKVCKKWHKICKDPMMWRTIDLHTDRKRNQAYDLEKICCLVTDLSCGNLVDIDVGNYTSDVLLQYIIDSSSGIRRLRLVGSDVVSDEGLIKVAPKLPLLEDLEIAICKNVSHRSLNVLGNSCPMLKSLKFNKLWVNIPFDDSSDDEQNLRDCGALAIAGTMSGLHHLQLFGNAMSHDGLIAILDGCPQLESLDLRRCSNLNLGGSLRRRCLKQIKNLLLPNYSLAGYAHPATFYDLYDNPKYIGYGPYTFDCKDYARHDSLSGLCEEDFGDLEPGDFMLYHEYFGCYD